MDTQASHTGLLADLPPAARERIAARARTRTVAGGEVVVKQDGPGDEMFVIRSGRFRVTSGDAALGLLREVAVLGPGDCFGEIAALHDQPRTATVRALTPCDLLVLPRDDFRRLLDDFPQAEQAFRRLAASRLGAAATG